MDASVAFSNTPSSSSGAFLGAIDVQSDDDLTRFSSEWYHAAALYPFQQHPVTQQLQHLHLEAQQQFQQQQMPQHEPFQHLTSASVVSSNNNTSGFHCPICLRVSAQTPIRQACGHALCLQCTQQAISMLGSCPLCRTQLIFDGNNTINSSHGRNVSGGAEVMEHGFLSNDMSFGEVGEGRKSYGDVTLVIVRVQTLTVSGNVLSYVRSPQARIQVQQQQQFDGPYLAQHEDAFQNHHRQGVTSPVPFEARDLHSDSDLTLQLDSLSDFGDMIDLPDLVASDSELSRYSLATVAAAAATAAGPVVSCCTSHC